MGLGSLLKKVFGGSGSKSASSKESEPVEHKGLLVIASPMKEGSQYRTAGFIEKRDGEEVKRVPFIRADNHTTEDAAIEHAVQKGKQIIDEQGERVLEREHA